MALQLASITVDCGDTARVAAFWSSALDRPLAASGTEWMQTFDDGLTPRWMFLKVPEGKSAKNRMHLDLVAPDREAEVDRLVEIGATRVDDHDEWGVRWTVLQDPEGNEFCVADDH